MFMSLAHIAEKQKMLKLKLRDQSNGVKASTMLFIRRICRCKIECDRFGNGLDFFIIKCFHLREWLRFCNTKMLPLKGMAKYF